jgi:hypothetical protein
MRTQTFIVPILTLHPGNIFVAKLNTVLAVGSIHHLIQSWTGLDDGSVYVSEKQERPPVVLIDLNRKKGAIHREGDRRLLPNLLPFSVDSWKGRVRRYLEVRAASIENLLLILSASCHELNHLESALLTTKIRQG